MSENKKLDDLDQVLCQEHYKKIRGSLFDPVKLQKLKLNSSFYASSLFKLECFVDALLSNAEIPFVPWSYRGGQREFVFNTFAERYFGSIPDFIEVINMLSPDYVYGERIKVFIFSCQAMGLLSEPLDWKNIHYDRQKTDPRFGGVSAAELFNALVQKIRSEWKSNNLQAKVNAQKIEANNRHLAYCKYADSLFADQARLVVVRIDLCYENQYANSMSVDNILADLDSLFRNKRANTRFRFMKGYIAKLEYSVDQGGHWHVIFFFDASGRKNSNHIKLTEDIGEYWIDVITKGRGVYWSSNKNTDRFDKFGSLGVGVINWDDTNLRRTLNELVIGYLCKVDQFSKPKWGAKVRVFRRGNFPKMRINKRGRPRKELESYTGQSPVSKQLIPNNPGGQAL